MAAQPAQAMDCTGSGLISSVTGGLCSILGGVGDTVDGVTDVVDGATGGLTAPVTKGVDDVVGGVTEGTGGAVSGVGEAVDDTVDSTVDVVGGTVKKVTDPLTGTSGGSGGSGGSGSGGSGGGTPGEGAEPTPGACIELPVLGGDCDGEQAAPPPAKPPAKPRPADRPPARTPAGTLPSEPARTIELPRFTPAGGKDVAPDPRVNLDEDGAIPLLWPGNQEIPGLKGGLKSDPVRPSQPYDAAGTALTAALLLSAVLATRVVSARRARMEQLESIPFEGGVRPARTSGRHRLA
ncbi:hypothetical protein [Planotetraspora phitsanulokensis]|uniref:hypothetical protein n=1 Tax=Planotetraspora phitsanulokensis TaxID=575192 RepID=UPI00195121E8|nr:hypothetical protein [Planotetraspora phitsanulokensis]